MNEPTHHHTGMRTSLLTYDDLGHRIMSKDPLNRQTGFAYDALSRLTQVTDPGSLVAGPEKGVRLYILPLTVAAGAG